MAINSNGVGIMTHVIMMNTSIIWSNQSCTTILYAASRIGSCGTCEPCEPCDAHTGLTQQPRAELQAKGRCLALATLLLRVCNPRTIVHPLVAPTGDAVHAISTDNRTVSRFGFGAIPSCHPLLLSCKHLDGR